MLGTTLICCLLFNKNSSSISLSIVSSSASVSQSEKGLSQYLLHESPFNWRDQQLNFNFKEIGLCGKNKSSHQKSIHTSVAKDYGLYPLFSVGVFKV